MSCECGVAGIGNSGFGKNNNMKKPVGLVFMRTRALDGSLNVIDLTNDTIDQAYLDAKYNESDYSKRWYPYTKIKGAEITSAESTFDEAADGTKDFVKNGIISFTGELRKVPNQLLCKLASMRCHDVSVFIIDECGGLFGGRLDKVNNELHPISLESQTIDALFGFATDSSVEKITLSFDFSPYTKVCSIIGIPNSSISGDLVGSRGMLSVTGEVSNQSETGLDVEYKGDFGSAIDLSSALGMDISNFVLEEVSPTPGAITITSVNEVEDGKYAIVAPMVSGGVYRLTATLSYHEIQVIEFTV